MRIPSMGIQCTGVGQTVSGSSRLYVSDMWFLSVMEYKKMLKAFLWVISIVFVS